MGGGLRHTAAQIYLGYNVNCVANLSCRCLCTCTRPSVNPKEPNATPTFATTNQTRPQVFHAGTTTNAAGDVVAAGGRVLGVTALGSDVAEAQKRAYEGVAAVEWEDGFWRKDIGWRAVERLGAARR